MSDTLSLRDNLATFWRFFAKSQRTRIQMVFQVTLLLLRNPSAMGRKLLTHFRRCSSQSQRARERGIERKREAWDSVKSPRNVVWRDIDLLKSWGGSRMCSRQRKRHIMKPYGRKCRRHSWNMAFEKYSELLRRDNRGRYTEWPAENRASNLELNFFKPNLRMYSLQFQVPGYVRLHFELELSVLLRYTI